MKKELIYFVFFLLLASYSCLDTPDMNSEFPNMRKEPTVTTKKDVVFSNENFTLTIKGEILTYGKSSDFFEQGFCWGTDSTYLPDSVFFTNNKAEIDTFSYELQNMDGNLTYYWQAIARNQYGVARGEIREYKTPSEEPSVISGEISAFPAEGSLLFKGEILAVGKINAVFEKGFYWGVDKEHLTDSVILENTDFKPGGFSYTLLSARGNTTYYWRAYAKNDYGISLGEVMTYKTPAIFEPEGFFTGELRTNFTAFTLKDVLYITCGTLTNTGTITNPYLNDGWRYDGRQWWSNFGGGLPKDTPPREYAIAFTLNDSLAYAGFGRGSAIYGDLYVFNGNTNSWSSDTPVVIQNGRYGAVAFSLNNKGYVVGGRNSSGILNDVQECTFVNMLGVTWEEKNNFPKPFSGGICFYDSKRVFAGFGNDGETNNTLWEYDATLDRWEEFAASPVSGGSIRSGIIIRDKIYLLCMTNGIHSLWELDLTTDKYKQKSMLPENFPRGIEQYIFSVGDAIYVGLGGTSLFYRYYPGWDN
ncbi:hypothetical protein FACS189451_01830 [Bacteroidia bacterium]|nr:hypothetical protein FACS189446_5800 [Bacteroidia bacterium]GHT60896.1 hypothetical protein FACS189451_01830 [Bacteroidia bacterium]